MQLIIGRWPVWAALAQMYMEITRVSNNRSRGERPVHNKKPAVQ